MVKFVAMVRRKEGLDFAEFARLWREEHAPLVLAMPGVRRYEQNLAHQGATRDWPYDGVAEVWFDDKPALNAAFASPAGVAANEHQTVFAGDVSWLLAEEQVWEPEADHG